MTSSKCSTRLVYIEWFDSRTICEHVHQLVDNKRQGKDQSKLLAGSRVTAVARSALLMTSNPGLEVAPDSQTSLAFSLNELVRVMFFILERAAVEKMASIALKGVVFGKAHISRSFRFLLFLTLVSTNQGLALQISLNWLFSFCMEVSKSTSLAGTKLIIALPGWGENCKTAFKIHGWNIGLVLFYLKTGAGTVGLSGLQIRMSRWAVNMTQVKRVKVVKSYPNTRTIVCL